MNVILWGGTGQAKVVRPIIENSGCRVVAVFDDTVGLKPPFDDIPLYCGKESFDNWYKENTNLTRFCGFCVAIGNPHGEIRLRISEYLQSHGLLPIDVIHKSAIIEPRVEYGRGIQMMAGSIINPETRIGEQCIINTNASVDHECVLGDGVEIGPGATITGLVTIGDYTWIGSGAVILPRIKIGKNVIVGAGAVVTKDISDNHIVVGVPARTMEK